ncbi:VPLPA-CTERM sorting domain-containing protein [Parvularcula sp. ZS-1/3]|uniref:VPLPA-CTERM sorting domain-containing protein n=1 Tax=Parvularcula mediterranea TaxID=2732508 RepID=A0A7Y3W3Y6_9PROT|nr:VPLPA-CTERM sorting domain-containing protein [Parvularcula mediterranea]NNU14949.1 VPLPA-CTERM sorting domain-containing protein [Parvularcula mediterranea]
MKYFAQAALGAATMLMGAAHAAPLTWTFEDTYLQDEREIVGTYDFDADTGTYSNIDVTILDYDGSTYLEFDSVNSSSTGNSMFMSFVFMDDVSDGASVLDIELVSAMTSAGGSIDINQQGLSQLGMCLTFNNFPCLAGQGQATGFLDGFVTAEAVPLPAAAFFMAAGLAGFGGMRMKKKAAQ